MSLLITTTSGLLVGAGAGAVLSIVINRLRKPDPIPPPTQTTFLFSGSIKQTSLIDAIQFLELGKREGVLHIYSGRRKGYITFSKGKVIDAFYRNVVAREAMFAMLELTDGDFYFESKMVEQPRIIADSIMDLVMNWDAVKQHHRATQ